MPIADNAPTCNAPDVNGFWGWQSPKNPLMASNAIEPAPQIWSQVAYTQFQAFVIALQNFNCLFMQPNKMQFIEAFD